MVLQSQRERLVWKIPFLQECRKDPKKLVSWEKDIPCVLLRKGLGGSKTLKGITAGDVLSYPKVRKMKTTLLKQVQNWNKFHFKNLRTFAFLLLYLQTLILIQIQMLIFLWWSISPKFLGNVRGITNAWCI